MLFCVYKHYIVSLIFFSFFLLIYELVDRFPEMEKVL